MYQLINWCRMSWIKLRMSELVIQTVQWKKTTETRMLSCLEDGIPGIVSSWDHPYLQNHFRPFGRGTTRSLGDLPTMVSNHLLIGMILQVHPLNFLTLGWSSRFCKGFSYSHHHKYDIFRRGWWNAGCNHHTRITFIFNYGAQPKTSFKPRQNSQI